VNGFAHAWRRLGLFCLISLAAIVQRTDAQTTICAELLAQLAPNTDGPRLDIGGRQVTVGRSYFDRVQMLLKEIGKVNEPGVVVYCPVQTEKGMSNIRFETQGEGKPCRSELIAESTVSPKEFAGLLRIAQQPSAEFTRTALRDLLLPGGNKADQGKMVFFRDIAFYDILPGALGHENATMLGTPFLADAIARRRSLAEAKISPGKFTAVIGYPETEADISLVFGNGPAENAAEWKRHADQFSKIAEKYGVQAFQGDRLKGLAGPEGVLKTMEEAEGIVFISAHASGCNILLPGSTSWTITPGQISSLKFKRGPFVVLRICNTGDPGFVRAFLLAGASGVWRNSGKIDAARANEEIEGFFATLHDGKSILEAVESGGAQSRLTTGLFTQIDPHFQITLDPAKTD
jgi:hypothetical protein